MLSLNKKKKNSNETARPTLEEPFAITKHHKQNQKKQQFKIQCNESFQLYQKNR